MNNIQAKDLTKEAPRSPYETLGGYAILPRTIDKCRSDIAHTKGEFHFNCPVDQMLFNFKKIDADAFKAYVAEDHTDNEILEWININGIEKSEDEIKEWSESFRSDFSYSTGEKAEWFIGECTRLGINPETNTLFDMLVEDDNTIGQ